MDKTMRTTIETLMGKVEAKSQEIAELKRTVNFLAREAGGEPQYPDEAANSSGGGLGTIAPDQFYGDTPTRAARKYLELRRRAVPAEEILEALDRGGFDFDAQGWKKNQLRNLSISLSKNSAIFHRLPNGTYGLVSFYPSIQAEKKKKPGQPPLNGGEERPAAEVEEEEAVPEKE